MSNIVEDALARWKAATAIFEQADREWSAASAAYRETYYEIQQRNRVLDDDGLPTDQVKPMGRFDRSVIGPYESREAAAWARRQAAAAAVAEANADLETFRIR